VRFLDDVVGCRIALVVVLDQDIRRIGVGSGIVAIGFLCGRYLGLFGGRSSQLLKLASRFLAGLHHELVARQRRFHVESNAAIGAVERRPV
jgi:hypothetical protein